MQELTKHSGRH